MYNNTDSDSHTNTGTRTRTPPKRNIRLFSQPPTHPHTDRPTGAKAKPKLIKEWGPKVRDFGSKLFSMARDVNPKSKLRYRYKLKCIFILKDTNILKFHKPYVQSTVNYWSTYLLHSKLFKKFPPIKTHHYTLIRQLYRVTNTPPKRQTHQLKDNPTNHPTAHKSRTDTRTWLVCLAPNFPHFPWSVATEFYF